MTGATGIRPIMRLCGRGRDRGGDRGGTGTAVGWAGDRGGARTKVGAGTVVDSGVGRDRGEAGTGVGEQGGVKTGVRWVQDWGQKPGQMQR